MKVVSNVTDQVKTNASPAPSSSTQGLVSRTALQKLIPKQVSAKTASPTARFV
jgi:hypothetical protein